MKNSTKMIKFHEKTTFGRPQCQRSTGKHGQGLSLNRVNIRNHNNQLNQAYKFNNSPTTMKVDNIKHSNHQSKK